jgi:DNA-binding transcriptional LysR family regulator
LFHQRNDGKDLVTLEPNDLVLFAKVVDEGSFSRAAERLGVPKSTISRRVAALESRLGEQLLRRTTRKLTVTDFGRAVLQHAHHVVEDVAAAASLAEYRRAQPSGRMRISMPSDMGNLLLAPLLAEFILEYPGVSLEIDLSARFVDLIGENFDLAIRVGDLRDDATLAAKRVATFSGGLYAAPSYVARHGLPTEPEALMEHRVLHILARDGEATELTLLRGEARWDGLPPGRATANSPELLLRMALHGVAIVRASDVMALPYLKRGELVQVLPEWSTPTVSVWAVFPGRRLMPAHTRAFVDVLAAKFSGEECQVVEDEVRRIKKRGRSVARSASDTRSTSKIEAAVKR